MNLWNFFFAAALKWNVALKLKNLAANTVGTDVRLAGLARNDSLTFLRKITNRTKTARTLVNESSYVDKNSLIEELTTNESTLVKESSKDKTNWLKWRTFRFFHLQGFCFSSYDLSLEKHRINSFKIESLLDQDRTNQRHDRPRQEQDMTKTWPRHDQDKTLTLIFWKCVDLKRLKPTIYLDQRFPTTVPWNTSVPQASH